MWLIFFRQRFHHCCDWHRRCFPLATSTACLENCEATENITGRADAAAPRKQSCNDRKQPFETLRSSIKDKGQAEAKKRKINEPPKLLENSKNGKDPKDLDRGFKVEVGQNDLQRSEFNKGIMQPCTNKGNNVDAKVLDAHGPTSMKREAQSIANLIQVGKAKMKKDWKLIIWLFLQRNT